MTNKDKKVSKRKEEVLELQKDIIDIMYRYSMETSNTREGMLYLPYMRYKSLAEKISIHVIQRYERRDHPMRKKTITERLKSYFK